MLNNKVSRLIHSPDYLKLILSFLIIFSFLFPLKTGETAYANVERYETYLPPDQDAWTERDVSLWSVANDRLTAPTTSADSVAGNYSISTTRNKLGWTAMKLAFSESLILDPEMDTLHLQIYAEDSNERLDKIRIWAPDYENRFEYDYKYLPLNVAGWTRIDLKLSDLSAIGLPDWNNASMIALSFGGGTVGDIKIDNLYFDRWTGNSNNPPSTPQLISPVDDRIDLETTVEFRWLKSTDPDGDTLTYTLHVCDISGCITAENTASPENKNIFYAGTGSGLLLFGIALAGGIRGKNKTALLLSMIMAASLFLVSCGSGSGGGEDNTLTLPPPDSNEITRTVSGLSTGTTYIWKVIVNDGNRGITESELRSFTTR